MGAGEVVAAGGRMIEALGDMMVFLCGGGEGVEGEVWAEVVVGRDDLEHLF